MGIRKIIPCEYYSIVKIQSLLIIKIVKMIEKRTGIVTNLRSEIIFQELLNASMFGVCLPANLLLCILLKRINIEFCIFYVISM